jgi:excisionase family DNA binding protein
MEQADLLVPIARKREKQAGLGAVSRSTVYRLIDEGHLVRVKIGSRSYITTASIQAYVASLVNQAAS